MGEQGIHMGAIMGDGVVDRAVFPWHLQHGVAFVSVCQYGASRVCRLWRICMAHRYARNAPTGVYLSERLKMIQEAP